MVTYLDTIADTTRYISAPTCSKIVFERENNISMRYIGGYRDTSITCDLTAEVDTLFTNEYMDSINAIIYIPKDTVTVTRITKFSYAIFEITRGSEVFLDTALYNLDYTSKCLNIYCCNPQNIYNTQDILNNYNSLYNTSLTTPFAYLKFIPYYPDNYCISVPSKNRKIYMIDIFPFK